MAVGEHAGTPSPVTEAGSHHMHDQTSLPHIHYESFVISEHSQGTHTCIKDIYFRPACVLY